MQTQPIKTTESTPSMDQFFLVKRNFIPNEKCQELIAKYQEDRHLSTVDVRKVSGVNELLLDDPSIAEKWENELNALVDPLTNEVGNFLKPFKTVYPDNYFFSHAVFWEQNEHKYTPYHYDPEFVIEPDSDKDPTRNFLCLLYLNGDYEGGEIMFPQQGKVVKPEAGMLVIFPTSFMFPHMTTPSIGNDRFLIRFTYYLDKEKKKVAEGY